MNRQNLNNGAYLDNFHKIKLVLSKDINIKSIYLLFNNNKFNLDIINTEYLNNVNNYYLNSEEYINPRYDYDLIINDNIIIPLSIGAIGTKGEFDSEYFFDDWLGFKYTKTNVTFRLWAPLSKEVYVIINESKKYSLEYIDKGVYEVKISNKNEWLDKQSYYYLIRNDRDFIKVIDPYGYSISSDLSKCYIFDFKKTHKLEYDYIDNTDSKKDNSIIYEMSVRDFTISLPLKHKGEFLGIVESSELDSHGINYLKDLGITHVQLGPVYAFGGVDYNIKDSLNPKFKYNWGYNPILYNALCGWYVSNPDDPYSQINEFKLMIDEFHKNNIGVILDVVYNHVYITCDYALNKIVPGYPYRNYANGELSNGSWCGNDVATERLMNHKFIIDSLKYYQKEFKIDGFRFDLMGLIDVDTINEAYKTLSHVNKNVLLYGEGWKMGTGYDSNKLAHMFNSSKVPNVGFFNDYFRNTLKGKAEHNSPSIIMKGEHNKDTFESLFSGNKIFGDYLQTINYVECHDNATFYDEQKKFGIFDGDAKENAKIALFFVLFSKGISFIHSGQEILRTKLGIDNSYNQPDTINKFPWHLMFINYDVLEYFKELVKIKKEINFSEYQFVKVMTKDKCMKVIFTNNTNKLNLYINLKNNKVKLDLAKENIVFGKYTKLDESIIFNKGCLITMNK